MVDDEDEFAWRGHARLIAHDFPLRPDLLIRLNLPVNMTEDDADRISAFVKSVVIPVGKSGYGYIDGPDGWPGFGKP